MLTNQKGTTQKEKGEINNNQNIAIWLNEVQIPSYGQTELYT